MPFGRTIHQRGEQLTGALTELVAGRAMTFVDAFNDRQLRRAEYWSPDRLHLAPAGHARVAALVLAALGHPVRATEMPPPIARRGVLAEARYYQQHVVPWVARRLRGRSSGDGREPKHRRWLTVAPD